jgi:hypothetical protein
MKNVGMLSSFFGYAQKNYARRGHKHCFKKGDPTLSRRRLCDHATPTAQSQKGVASSVEANMLSTSVNVRYWHKADIQLSAANVRFWR